MTIMPNTHIKEGEVVFSEGDIPDGAYLVCSGKVEVTKQKNARENIVLATLGENSIFGEMALIGNARRSATITALEDTWCYKSSSESFKEKLKNLDPEISEIFVELVGAIRQKSDDMVINSSDEDYSLDELALLLASQDAQYKNAVPMLTRGRRELLEDEGLKKKVESLDNFMRQLYFSLVKIAFM
ncbi:cyclic nucleotide-binding domain-containing protein [Rickettsiales bacterium]|nr:cyclic nucleotide-binding domain-containing protein [Rickettsiales bacterium]